jgi:plastocyanin
MKQILSLLCSFIVMGAYAQTTHELFVSDFEFNPAVINAVQGDSLRILAVDPGHTFTQVSEETWNANGNEPSGQYQFDFLMDTVTVELTGSGTIHYVCSPHAAMGMKGIVNVALAAGITDHRLLRASAFYPNPATDVIRMRNPSTDILNVSIVDAMGREVARMQVLSTEPLYVGDLPAGLYLLRVMDKAGSEMERQRLMVAR